MSKGLETISVLDDYLIVDTINRRVCEVSNSRYDNMFRGTRFANEMATLLVEYRNRIAELEEQLKNAIVPKFKIGQEVWSIFESQYFRDCKELCNLEITAIMNTNKGIFYQGYVLEKGKNRCDYWFDEKNTFLTKEEAQERLKNYEKL